MGWHKKYCKYATAEIANTLFEYNIFNEGNNKIGSVGCKWLSKMLLPNL
jgi:hypothetical protein